MRKKFKKSKQSKKSKKIVKLKTPRKSMLSKKYVRPIFILLFAASLLFAALSFLISQFDAQNAAKNEKSRNSLKVATLNLLNFEKPISLIATGDILPARWVELKMRQLNDYTYPFHKTADFLKSADITFGNLESPFFPGKNVPKGSMTFRADADFTNGLLFAGYDVLSIANNHAMNYQVPGLTTTIQALKKAGILYAGAGKNEEIAHTPAVFEIRGVKIAFYAYNDPNIPPRYHGEAAANKPGIARMDIDAVKNDVKNAFNLYGADIVVVSMHAGVEYRREPTQFQKDFARAAIDAGASAVIGHHPHWVQSVEYYKDGVILYSLGNFVFDQFFSEDVKTGLIAKINLEIGDKPEVELYPVKIENAQPRILEGEEKEKVLKRIGLF